mmetsp:Transcript_32444/g.75381  ORF Transcript_32444/g.75381 Transcript_32444/m.75381 type:complete len:174 (-) Transcript_32444:32-553(-)
MSILRAGPQNAVSPARHSLARLLGVLMQPQGPHSYRCSTWTLTSPQKEDANRSTGIRRNLDGQPNPGVRHWSAEVSHLNLGARHVCQRHLGSRRQRPLPGQHLVGGSVAVACKCQRPECHQWVPGPASAWAWSSLCAAELEDLRAPCHTLGATWSCADGCRLCAEAARFVSLD